MKRVVAFLLAVPLSLLTYGLGSVTWRVSDGQLGHSHYDGPVLVMYWMVLIILWALVLWMFEKKRRI